MELKPLLDMLKYTFLGESETLLVIISSHLDKDQEGKLLDILGEHKEAIGWTIADKKRISSSVIMHQIHLEKNAKISREPQRHLNPVLKELMRTDVMKLLDVSIIYPISDVNGSVLCKLCPKSLEPQSLLTRIISWFQLMSKLVGERA